jgi:hypothetical protein
MLFIATDKMHCGTPGVPCQRLQASQCIDPNDRCVSSQRCVLGMLSSLEVEVFCPT